MHPPPFNREHRNSSILIADLSEMMAEVSPLHYHDLTLPF